MDAEIIIWALVYVGGYGLILGYLLSVAFRNPGDGGPPTIGH